MGLELNPTGQKDFGKVGSGVQVAVGEVTSMASSGVRRCVSLG